MKIKSILILLLLSILVNAGTQKTQQGQQQKVFISVGDKYGSDETDANCFATIADSQQIRLVDQAPMYYNGGSLYYFLTDKKWEKGTYTASFTCTSLDGTKSGILPFIISPFLEGLNEGQSFEEKENWFEKLTGLIPFGIGNSFKILGSVFATSLNAILFIPKFFIALFGLFVWIIKNIWIVLMLFEVYVLSSAISQTSLTDQVSTFVQKNVYAIDFIIRVSLMILTFAVRVFNGLLSSVTNLIPFT